MADKPTSSLSAVQICFSCKYFPLVSVTSLLSLSLTRYTSAGLAAKIEHLPTRSGQTGLFDRCHHFVDFATIRTQLTKHLSICIPAAAQICRSNIVSRARSGVPIKYFSRLPPCLKKSSVVRSKKSGICLLYKNRYCLLSLRGGADLSR